MSRSFNALLNLFFPAFPPVTEDKHGVMHELRQAGGMLFKVGREAGVGDVHFRQSAVDGWRWLIEAAEGIIMPLDEHLDFRAIRPLAHAGRPGDCG
jgi:hypothetical protein